MVKSKVCSSDLRFWKAVARVPGGWRFAEEHDVALTAMREAWVRVDTIYVTMGAAGKIYSTAPFYKTKIDFKRTKTDCMS